MKRDWIVYSFLVVCVLILVYVALAVYFRSASPAELFSYVTSDTWRLDSASVQRRVHHIHGFIDQDRYGTTADSVWNFSVRLYGRNLVGQTLRIDSIEVLNLLNHIRYQVRFSEQYDPSSRMTINLGLIVGKQSFLFGDYIADSPWRVRDRRAVFQAQLDSAFEQRALTIRVRSSRGVLTIAPLHYITTGHFLEWTKDIRVSQR